MGAFLAFLKPVQRLFAFGYCNGLGELTKSQEPIPFMPISSGINRVQLAHATCCVCCVLCRVKLPGLLRVVFSIVALLLREGLRFLGRKLRVAFV